MKSPREVVLEWVDAFNRRDADAAAALYHDDAVNLQVAEGSPTVGRQAMRDGFAYFFRAFPDNYTNPVNLFEDGEWAILEWTDPKGMRGCGFFHVKNGKIAFQRGYWDKLSFHKLYGTPINL